MLCEHLLDLGRAGATLDPPDCVFALDEHERRHHLDLELRSELRSSVDVDPRRAQTVAFLAREMCEQALHPARGAGALAREEDEQRPSVVIHCFPPAGMPGPENEGAISFPLDWRFKPGQYTRSAWGPGTGSASARGSEPRSACSPWPSSATPGWPLPSRCWVPRAWAGSSPSGPARSRARSAPCSDPSVPPRPFVVRWLAAAPAQGLRSWSAPRRSSWQGSRSFRCSATSSRWRCPSWGYASAGGRASATQVFGSLPATKALLIVIDGVTPAMYEDAVERRTAPALAELHERGQYRRAATVFPSLTPVCLSSLVTGAYPDVHGIPHLVWYHRGEQRLVEYGSSFAALPRAGTRRGILYAVFRMNEEHLSRRAKTLYESVEEAGRVAAAVNIICYRGRTPHVARIPGVTRAAHGPKRFFYFNLFESDETGAPFRPGARQAGGNDRYAGAVGRWLVTRDGFDLLVCYLPDYDYASHSVGPDSAHAALARADDAVRALLDAAGGVDALLERYAVVVCSDHGQTRVERTTSLHGPFVDVDDVVVTASNRAGMVYDLRGGRARVLAEYPDGLASAAAALRNRNSGDVLVSASPGYEFTDLAGRHHAGGGSHGSLLAGDSEVPVLAIGLGPAPASITGIAPLLLDQLGLQRPDSARALSHV